MNEIANLIKVGLETLAVLKRLEYENPGPLAESIDLETSAFEVALEDAARVVAQWNKPK